MSERSERIDVTDLAPDAEPQTPRTAPARRAASDDHWVRAWPLNRPAAVQAVAGSAILLAVACAVGLLFMALLDDGPVGDADRSWARWLEDHRTAGWDTFTEYGSMLSDTFVKVALVAVVGGVMVVAWRRWHDGVFLALAVVVEASVFVITSFVVGRDRPPVVKLDPPAPSGSFPSGHTAAAVAFYAGVYLVVRWHTGNRAVRAVFLVIAVVVPITVGFSRSYRGMHHPIDVAAGAVLGLAALYVTYRALLAGCGELGRRRPDAPERLRRLDLTRPSPTATPATTDRRGSS